MTTAIAVIIAIMAIFFFAYIFLMIFYPEWVGITGKAARKTMDDHKQGTKADDPTFFSDLRK
jgi:hypothetical protein